MIGETSVMDGFGITTALKPRLDPPKQNGKMAEVAAYAKRLLNTECACSNDMCMCRSIATLLNAVSYAV